jgi:nucleosome-remodeling factor subunit BPTF
MKYTRSAAQKSQQQLRHQLEEEQEDEEEEQIENNIKSSKNKVRKSLNNSKNKSKSSNKTKQSGRKSTSKKKKSKYFSDSEDDYDDNNNNNNYEYEDDIDVGDEYYEAEDDYAYESYINTNKKKVNKKTVPIAEDEIISDVDIELEDDENTQDTHATRKSQSSDNDYFNIFDNDDNSGDSLPELKLPKSSEDLLILNENILDCISVYETLRRFRNILRLSPFLFEDFCACLNTNENSSLFSEVHLSLIKILLKEDEVSLVSYGPTDLKTCIDVSFHLIDSFTWPEILRQYIESDMKMLSLNSNLLNILNKPTYPLVNISDKLTVLISLCNMFLSSLAVRNDLLSEGNIVSDDHCRICHKLGNLLCCETCPATYHLDCLDPPLTNVPEDDWICSICRLHQVIFLFFYFYFHLTRLFYSYMVSLIA